MVGKFSLRLFAPLRQLVHLPCQSFVETDVEVEHIDMKKEYGFKHK